VKEIPQLLIKSSNPMHNLTRKKKIGERRGWEESEKEREKENG
jgi:hypothetical protein